ncbi:IS3 family transposase [Nocardia brasiliensis]|uniref:IS3 family transposase n=1 Tax=Nocardia brasiliensis TaxID=37326 RepID=UPI003D8C7092
MKDHPQHSVELVLRVLGIASSTFYGWLQQVKAPSQRRLADEQLLAEIVDIHISSGGTYGSPRVHAMLRRRGIAVGRKRVERLMRAAGLQGAFLRRKWRIPSTRQIAAPRRRRIWSTATSPQTPRTGCGWRMRRGSRPERARSGWWRSAMRSPTGSWAGKCSDRCDTELVLGALEYAVWVRDVRAGQLVHHSDRGSTYTAIRFANRLADNGIAQSMGSVGDSYDNALMENFFSTLKTELVYRNSWHIREDAENALFSYIDGWYNTQRIQKKLDWRSPDEYEASYHHRVPAGTR